MSVLTNIQPTNQPSDSSPTETEYGVSGRGPLPCHWLLKSHVVCMQVKAAGVSGSSWAHNEAASRDAYRSVLLKAAKQLNRASHVFRFITPDLIPPPDITLVIAVPFMSRRQLHQVRSAILSCLFTCSVLCGHGGPPVLSFFEKTGEKLIFFLDPLIFCKYFSWICRSYWKVKGNFVTASITCAKAI